MTHNPEPLGAAAMCTERGISHISTNYLELLIRPQGPWVISGNKALRQISTTETHTIAQHSHFHFPFYVLDKA